MSINADKLELFIKSLKAHGEEQLHHVLPYLGEEFADNPVHHPIKIKWLQKIAEPFARTKKMPAEFKSLVHYQQGTFQTIAREALQGTENKDLKMKVLECLLLLYPEAIHERDDANRGIIYHLNAEQTEKLFSLMPKSRRMAAFQNEVATGELSFIRALHKCPKYFKDALSLLPTETLCEMTETSNLMMKMTNHPESLEATLNHLPIENRFNAITYAHQPINLISASALSNAIQLNNEAFEIIIDALPKEDCLGVSQVLLNEAVFGRRLPKIEQRLTKLSSLLTLDGIHQLKSFRSANGKNIFHQIFWSPSLIAELLDFYSKEELFLALQEKDANNNLPLLLAAEDTESLNLLLARFSSEECLALARLKGGNTNHTLLHCFHNNPEALKLVLSKIPTEERLALLSIQNELNWSSFETLCSSFDTIKITFLMLNETDKLTLMKKKFGSLTFVERLTQQAPAHCLENLLTLFSQESRRLIVLENEPGTKNLLFCRPYSLSHLTVLIKALEEPYRTYALRNVNDDNKTILELQLNSDEGHERLNALLTLIDEGPSKDQLIQSHIQKSDDFFDHLSDELKERYKAFKDNKTNFSNRFFDLNNDHDEDEDDASCPEFPTKKYKT